MKMSKIIPAVITGVVLCASQDAFAYVRTAKYVASNKSSSGTTGFNLGGIRQYVGVKVIDGISTKFTDIDNAKYSTSKYFGGEINYGLKINDFRAELEGKFTTVSKYSDRESTPYYFISMDTEISYMDFMLNGYFDKTIYKKLSGFVMFGIGAERAYMNGDIIANDYYGIDHIKLNDKKFSFAYQLGLGIEYDITQNTTVDFGYRYIDVAKNVYDLKFHHHELFLGARLYF